MTAPNYTVLDYVRWMGDHTFEELPFSDADAIVLCSLSYYDLYRYNPSVSSPLTTLIAAAPTEDPAFVKVLGGGEQIHSDFIHAVASSRRYAGLVPSSYEDTYDAVQDIQFCAVSFDYGDLFRFIAYRGTDDTISGWKEDFMISFTETYAQKMALQYARKEIVPGKAIYLGGHSKGGNLALYAACGLTDEEWSHVTHLYLMDSPGLCPEVMDPSLLDRLQDKTTRIIPEFSVIGKLFEPKVRDTRIVSSSKTGVMQHELLSWGIRKFGLDTVPKNDSQAERLNSIIRAWISNVSRAERETFVNQLFDALSADGSRTMTEVSAGGFDNFDRILFSIIGVDKDILRTVIGLPEQVLFGNTLQEIRQNGFLTWARHNAVIQSVLLLLAGAVFLLVPDFILSSLVSVVFIGLTVFQLGFTLYRLIQNKWKLEAVKERLYFCAILVVVCICMFFKEQAVFLLGSILLAIIAFILAVYTGADAANKQLSRHIRILHTVETAVCILVGLSFLVIPRTTVHIYALGIGIFLILDALFRLGSSLYSFIKSRKTAKMVQSL